MGISSPIGAVSTDPFAPSQQTGPTPFGFSIPTGDPEEITAAANQVGLIGLDWTTQSSGVTQALQAAIDGAWTGPAQEAFSLLSEDVAALMNVNGDAATTVATALHDLAAALTTAQSACRSALSDCQTAQTTLTNNPTNPPLNPSDATRHTAAAAQSDLDDAKRRGVTAANDYQTKAESIARQITEAESDLRELPIPQADIPVPVNVTSADATEAEKLWKELSSWPGSSSLTVKQRLALAETFNGGPLTPGEIQAYDKIYALWKVWEKQHPTGNLVDELGGFLNFVSWGLIKFGNPKSLEYELGQLGGAVPIDPDSDARDIFKGFEFLNHLLSQTKTKTASSSSTGSIPTKVSYQKQQRHIKGTKEYIAWAKAKKREGGYFNSQQEAQQVLDDVHSGEATVVGHTKEGWPIIEDPNVTGTNVNTGAGYPEQPTHTFYVKGTSSPSVVPTWPGRTS